MVMLNWENVFNRKPMKIINRVYRNSYEHLQFTKDRASPSRLVV